MTAVQAVQPFCHEVSGAACTCVAHKHDKVFLGNEGVQEVGEAGCVHSGHKQAGEAVRHVGEAWNLVLPGDHAAGGVIHVVVKHHALHVKKAVSKQHRCCQEAMCIFNWLDLGQRKSWCSGPAMEAICA